MPISVSLSRSKYLVRSGDELSLYTIERPFDEHYHDQRIGALPSELLELYHTPSPHAAAYRYSIYHSVFDSTASLRKNGDDPDSPAPPAQSIAEPPRLQSPKGMKLFVLVACTYMAVFL